MDFEIFDGKAILLRCRNFGNRSVRIPAEYGGCPVVAIGSGAFDNNQNLEEVDIPPTLFFIGRGAFYGCKKLRLVYAGDTSDKEDGISTFSEDIYIADYAFTETRLVDVVFSGEKVVLGEYAFQDCPSLRNIHFEKTCFSLKLGKGCFRRSGIEFFSAPMLLERLPAETFAGCRRLRNVDFCAEQIDENAFQNCSALHLLPLKEGLQRIFYPAFDGCGALDQLELPATLRCCAATFRGSGLRALKVSAENPQYTSEGGVLYDKNKWMVIACPPKKEDEVVLPDSVNSICPGAFWGSHITGISMKNVAAIGEHAFFSSSIQKLELPKKLHFIAKTPLKTAWISERSSSRRKFMSTFHAFRVAQLTQFTFGGTKQNFEVILPSRKKQNALLFG